VDREGLSFEDAFCQLEQTVSALEQGDLSLERALALFEEGMHLVRRCNAILDQAELRIRQLTPSGDGYVAVDLD
jgi:exodeoxyribonuclease VII small subunit